MQYESARLAGFSPSVRRPQKREFDLPFFALSMLLLIIGVFTVFSASYARSYYDPSGLTGGNAAYYFLRQGFFALLGVGAMLAVSRIPLRTVHRYAFHFLIGTLVLLALVPILGVSANGSKRWISIGGFTLQPSELCKLSEILSFASLICRMGQERMKTFRCGILPFAAILGIMIALLVLEPHFSASIILMAVAAVMLFLGGVRMGWFAAAFSAAGIGIAVLLTLFPYASSRIVTWRDPFSSASDEGYQIVQSLYAIGSGGLSGLGLGQSRQKYLYLPEEHNDFIFAVLCEELGFIGAATVIVLFALLIARGFYIAFHAKSRYSFLVCCGVSALLALQVFLNVAVVTNLIPCTGISLPLFSYGGTALLLQLAELGLILSASREMN